MSLAFVLFYHESMFPVSSRILILDDMPTIRELVRNQLSEMGYKNIQTAESGDEGWNQIVNAITEGNPFHLVISDWNMPKVTGLELLKMVRKNEQTKKLPFVLLTSESERDQVTEAVLSGVSQYIVKPFTPRGFEEKLRAVWQKYNPKK